MTIGALAVACALLTLAIATVGGASAAPNGGGGCPNAGEPATQVSRGDLRRALECLINKERKSEGSKALDHDRKLAKAARRHVKAMVNTDCLEHVCGNEASLETRIRNTGYFSGARRFNYAEDVGCERSAAQMVKRWMGSSLHRDNLLNKNFKHFGASANHGRVQSRCDAGFVTFVVVLGSRAG
jgi:uncharacterized protein YkwD